jgi:hypothetical protein
VHLGTPTARSGLRYNIYVDGVLRQRYVSAWTPGPAPEIDVQCTVAPGTGALLSGGSQVEVRAVDLAGNESAAHAPFVLSATCQAQVDDADLASSESAPDAAPTLPVARPAESGCALLPGMQGRTRGALWAWSLASFGLALRARRARARSAR